MILALPFLDPPGLKIGSFELAWPHGFWSLAVLLMFALFMARVEASGRDGRGASELFAVALLSSLAGLVLLSPHGMRSPVAVASGAAGALLYSLYLRSRKGWPLAALIEVVDACFAAAPLPLLTLRAGCLLEHAHAGIRSDSWLAVDYPGGPRWDLALLEMLFFAGLWGLFRTPWIRQPWRPVAFLALYGLFRAGIEPLRIDFYSEFQFPAGLVAAAVVVAAVLLAFRRVTSRTTPR